MSTSYGTIADADAYHAARGNAAWVSADMATKNAALLVASEYIDANYRAQFPGTKIGYRLQEREWPRSGAYDWQGYTIGSAEIPAEVIRATYEVALQQIVSPGSLRTNVTMGEAITSASVDGAISVTYKTPMDASDYQITLPIVDAILAPILTGSNSEVSALSGGSWRG